MNGRVEVPVPGAPNPGDVTEKGSELSAWLASQGKPFFILIACVIGAFVVMSLLRRPFVRGLVVGAIVLALVAAAVAGAAK